MSVKMKFEQKNKQKKTFDVLNSALVLWFHVVLFF